MGGCVFCEAMVRSGLGRGHVGLRMGLFPVELWRQHSLSQRGVSNSKRYFHHSERE